MVSCSVGRDLVAAVRLIRQPECRFAPLKELGKYFFKVAASRLPGRPKLVKPEARIDMDRYLQVYDQATASFHPYQRMLEQIIALMDLQGKETVLDLFSGTGNLSEKIRPQAGRVISVDCSDVAIRLHRQKYPLAEIQKVNLDRPDEHLGFIDLPDQSVDIITTANSWYQVKNDQTLLAEIRRLLRPGGALVLQVEAEPYNSLPILVDHWRTDYQNRRADGVGPCVALVKVYMAFIAKEAALLVTAAETAKLMLGVARGDYRLHNEQTIIGQLAANSFHLVSGTLRRVYAGQGLLLMAQPV